MPSQVLPSDTAVLFERFAAACANLGLLLEKYQPWERVGEDSEEWDLTFRVRERRRGQERVEPKRGGEAKGLWLRDRQERNMVDDPLLPATHIDQNALTAYHGRWEAMVKAQGGEPFTLKTDWRMVVGLGGPSVLETAMTLHHVCGFPIIPGSSLKGLARVRALLGVAEQLGVPVFPLDEYQKRTPDTPLARLEAFLVAEDEKAQADAWERLKDDPVMAAMPLQQLNPSDLSTFASRFRTIFGYPGYAGQVIFFDGVPAELPRFALDVMNAHYPDYYSDEEGKVPPADYQNPNPVHFLTVDGGCRFWFAVAPRIAGARELASQAAGWLRAGLRTMGAGAKTVAGYGYFR